MQVYSIPNFEANKTRDHWMLGCCITRCITCFLLWFIWRGIFQQEQKTLLFFPVAPAPQPACFYSRRPLPNLVLYMGLQSSLLIAQCVAIATFILVAYSLSRLRARRE